MNKPNINPQRLTQFRWGILKKLAYFLIFVSSFLSIFSGLYVVCHNHVYKFTNINGEQFAKIMFAHDSILSERALSIRSVKFLNFIRSDEAVIKALDNILLLSGFISLVGLLILWVLRKSGVNSTRQPMALAVPTHLKNEAGTG